MPIRFRCPHCSRLLGIAKRKAGTTTNCPQCGCSLTVPTEDERDQPFDLTEFDSLLNSLNENTSAVASEPLAAPSVAVEEPPPTPLHQTTPTATKPAPPRTTPAKKPRSQRQPGEEEPLLEEDVDSLLGIARPVEKLNLDDEPPGKTPVSGMDAMSLGHEPRKLVLSSHNVMLLVVAIVVLLGLAFGAGFLIASHL